MTLKSWNQEKEQMEKDDKREWRAIIVWCLIAVIGFGLIIQL